MSDPQLNIRRWLAERLEMGGRGTAGRLAAHLNVRADAITRMANTDPAKESRRVHAHELDQMMTFFQDYPFLSGKDEPRRVSIREEYEEEQSQAGAHHQAYSRENYRPQVPGAVPEIDVELGAGEGRVGEVLSLPIGAETYSGHRVVEEWLLPETFYDRVLEARSGNTLVMPVVGDSMMPTYNPGDRVLVDLAQDQMTTDTVYAISDGFSPPQIKRLQRVMFSQPTEVQIISDNAYHSPQTVPLGALKIIGRIVGVVAKR